MASKKKKPPAKKKMTKAEAVDWARTRIHHALFGLTRMNFDLIDLLAFTSGNRRGDTISDSKLYHLRVAARDAFADIEEAIDLLRPHATRLLHDADGAFAALDRTDA